MSGLVNDLVASHFSGTPANLTPSPKNTEFKNPQIPVVGVDMKTLETYDLEQECCKHPTRPCKHWVWDTDRGDGYRNILSGQFKEAE